MKWESLKFEKKLELIEVYKTNIQTEEEAAELKALIQNSFSGVQVNFDLDDCDRILRVKACLEAIIQIPILLMEMGYLCSPLPD